MTWRTLELAPGRFHRWWERFHTDHPDVEAHGYERGVELRSSDGSIARFDAWYPVVEGADLPTQVTRAPETIGLILIRRGGYTIGLAHAGELTAHKSGTRYVQSRTAAGGWSQQRFARRRANQAQGLVAVASGHAARILAPLAAARDGGLAVGGDALLVEQVLTDARLAPLTTLPRRAFPDIPDPRFKALQEVLRRAAHVPTRVYNP